VCVTQFSSSSSVALFDIKEPNCIAMRFADKLAPDCLHLLCNSLVVLQ
jgi:hypothetical protein